MAGTQTTVAFVLDDLGPGGAQGQLALIAPALSARARVVVYVTGGALEPWADVIRGAGVTVERFRRTGRFDLALVLSLARAMRRDDVDVVHGFLNPANAYATAAAALAGRPVVLSQQSDRMVFPAIHAHLLRVCFRRADAVTVNSRAGYRFLVDDVGTHEAKTHLIPNWIDVADDLPQHEAHPPTVGFAGRLVALKRVDVLLDAFGDVRRNVPESRLVIMGDGPERGALEERTRDLGLSDAVEFTGAVAGARDRIAGLSLLCIPSAWEGLPNVALEALAEGVPVVARPVGDLGELVLPGRTGEIAPDDSAATLARTIVAALGDDALAIAARTEGPALVRRAFSLSGAADKLTAIYATLRNR